MKVESTERKNVRKKERQKDRTTYREINGETEKDIHVEKYQKQPYSFI
jgi:hypothetical protein